MGTILFDDDALVNVFRNVPVSVVGWRIGKGDISRTRKNEECTTASIVINDAFSRMTGYSPYEMEVRFDSQIAPMIIEEERGEFIATLHELSQYPHERLLHSRIMKADTNELDIQIKLNSVRQADGSMWIYAVMTGEDYHHRRMMAPAAKKSESAMRVKISTFGFFNVLIDGKPIAFQHEKSKELLALLVDRQGKFVSSSEIISCLWEDEPVSDNTRSRCRKAAFYLREILEKYDLEEIVESTSKGYRRIRTEMIDCDLYHYLNGDPAYAHAFRGAYMADYSWAETTLTSLMYAK